MIWPLALLGLVAGGISLSMLVPPSRELVIKLGTLIDVTRDADGVLFAEAIAPLNPFADGKFQHKRLTGILKADLSRFGAMSQRLQREAKKLDRRAHLAMIPFGVYVLGAALWLAL